MNLNQWTSIYLNHVNNFKKNIKERKDEKEKIVCFLKNGGKTDYFVIPVLSKDIEKEGSIVIVCLNIKENLNHIIEEWDSLIKNPKLKIMFVNPEENTHWSLIPHLHAKISDEKSLKRGLMSLFESVPEATKPF